MTVPENLKFYSSNIPRQIFEADPLRIPHMTEELLSGLELMHETWSPSLSEEKPEARPPDLTSIMEQLDWFHEPLLQCRFLNPPGEWLQALIQSTLLPWLWDLDFEMVRRKEKSKRKGREWNWELFVRQLAQPDIFEAGSVVKDLPLGLRNRRRIWRLVDDLLSARLDK